MIEVGVGDEHPQSLGREAIDRAAQHCELSGELRGVDEHTIATGLDQRGVGLPERRLQDRESASESAQLGCHLSRDA